MSSFGTKVSLNSTTNISNVSLIDGSNRDMTNNECLNMTAHQILFQIANVCFIISYMIPNGKHTVIVMHMLLICGFLLFSSAWAWNMICIPEVFIFNFCFMMVNLGQTFYLLYTMRRVKVPKELDDVFEVLFKPIRISRPLFKKLVSPEYCQIMSLTSGEAYAMENLTRTDRLGLLISGRVNVIANNHYLHSIEPNQFLDSPEFESNKTGTENFKVSIIAAISCKYIFWQRHSLEYLLIKEPFLAHVLSLILARDIMNKLYVMNEKIVTEKGSHLDIRLPSIITSLCDSASSVEVEPHNEQSSPIRPKLGLRVKDRPFMTVPKNKGNRSQSLQTNSLGFPLENSSHMNRSAMRLSPKRESLDPTHISCGFSRELINMSPSHGVTFKVERR